MIGAHYMFEDGASDQPKIGTVEDFYLINNLWEDHPMHIHLINHQVVKDIDLSSYLKTVIVPFISLTS